MPISYAEYARLSCPACGAGFDADVWTLVDAAERPDLAQALRDGALNVATCPRCGYAGPAGAPLLFHDPVGRRVYFAVPPGVDEHAWRERAQSLLYLLAGSLPEEDRRPYLGDVQVEHEVDGVRRAILRRERGRRSDRATGRPGDRAPEAPVVRDVVSSPPRPVAPPPEDPSELLAAIRALLAADSEAEFAATVAANPRLLSDEGDAAIAQLADLAYDQGERDVAAALREARVTLARMRAGGRGQRPEARDQPSSAYDSVPDPRPPTPDPQLLSDSAYQALL
ncbi:MAG TPA: CpXC domain-containing protein, partial [Roseiflexaceae bacterium]